MGNPWRKSMETGEPFSHGQKDHGISFGIAKKTRISDLKLQYLTVTFW
jgi:hypothetical protein